jgi:hypothetical protein
MTNKANPAASIHNSPVLIPGGSYFHDGSPFNRQQGGIVYAPDGRILSVAEPGCVPDTGYTGPVFTPFKGHLLPSNRVAELRIASNAPTEPIKLGYGFEWELPVVDAKTGEVKAVTAVNANGRTEFLGKLGKLSGKYGKVTAEAHNYVAELGVEPASSLDEMSYNMIMGVSEMVEAIVADGGLPVPVDVVGHRKMGMSERSTDRYVSSTTNWLAGHGHFTQDFPIDTFLVAYAAQFHRDIRDTEAAVQAAGLMQSANVVLAAIGVNGPFFLGKRTIYDEPDFNDEQWEVLQNRGLNRGDLVGERLSWRSTLRNIVSPSAGTWREMPPSEVNEYLGYCHNKLLAGKASSCDRSAANHGDRLRLTIGKTGTFENLSQPNVPSLHSQISALVVWNAIFTSVEEMILKGDDPREVAPFLFGATLEQARKERLLTDRLGADVFRGGKPLYMAKEEVRQVAERSKLNELTKFYLEWHLRSYASGATTVKAIRRWCSETGSAPSMQAFHELGIGAPAYYAIERYKYLHELHPELSESDIIQDCNLDNGRAFVREVEMARKNIELKRWR